MAAIQANCRDYLTELSAPRDDDLKVKFVSNFNQLGLEDKNTRDTCFDRGKNFALKLHNSKGTFRDFTQGWAWMEIRRVIDTAKQRNGESCKVRTANICWGVCTKGRGTSSHLRGKSTLAAASVSPSS